MSVNGMMICVMGICRELTEICYCISYAEKVQCLRAQSVHFMLDKTYQNENKLLIINNIIILK